MQHAFRARVYRIHRRGSRRRYRNISSQDLVNGTSSDDGGNNGEKMPAEHQTVQVSEHARGLNRAQNRNELIRIRSTCSSAQGA